MGFSVMFVSSFSSHSRIFHSFEEWHEPTHYNGHLLGPVTLTNVTERVAVELSLPVLTTYACTDRGLKSDLPDEMRMIYLYATAAAL